jgi:hypothetical protein
LREEVVPLGFGNSVNRSGKGRGNAGGGGH